MNFNEFVDHVCITYSDVSYLLVSVQYKLYIGGPSVSGHSVIYLVENMKFIVFHIGFW